ncbi:MAG TPA: signal peptidase I [Acidimicrobiia bacterium]|nr:signal peptidase I [Acidimicrobiia bacterium]
MQPSPAQQHDHYGAYEWPPKPDAPVVQRGGPKPRKARWLALAEWLILIVSAFAIALLIKTFLFQAFYIPSPSMDPTLKVHDRVLVNKLSYHLHDVHRGDIIVFKRHKGMDPANKDLVKRVIGLPYETVSLKDGYVYIDGKKLPEPYLSSQSLGQSFPESGLKFPVKVPAHSYFMMGDNRTNSSDSRTWGFVPEKDIVGRVFIRIWPLTRLDLF